MARIEFALELVRAPGRDPVEAGAMLLVPVPPGESWRNLGKILEVSRDASSYTADPRLTGAASGTWQDGGVPAARFSAQAWLREDGRLGLAWEVAVLETTGARLTKDAEGRTFQEPLTQGPTFAGQAIFPATGGTLLLAEIEDGRGRKAFLEATMSPETPDDAPASADGEAEVDAVHP
jgi:hypothetical protein